MSPSERMLERVKAAQEKANETKEPQEFSSFNGPSGWTMLLSVLPSETEGAYVVAYRRFKTSPTLRFNYFREGVLRGTWDEVRQTIRRIILRGS